MHGPICIFWANLTPFSRKARDEALRKELPVGAPQYPDGSISR